LKDENGTSVHHIMCQTGNIESYYNSPGTEPILHWHS